MHGLRGSRQRLRQSTGALPTEGTADIRSSRQFMNVEVGHTDNMPIYDWQMRAGSGPWLLISFSTKQIKIDHEFTPRETYFPRASSHTQAVDHPNALRMSQIPRTNCRHFLHRDWLPCMSIRIRGQRHSSKLENTSLARDTAELHTIFQIAPAFFRQSR